MSTHTQTLMSGNMMRGLTCLRVASFTDPGLWIGLPTGGPRCDDLRRAACAHFCNSSTTFIHECSSDAREWIARDGWCWLPAGWRWKFNSVSIYHWAISKQLFSTLSSWRYDLYLLSNDNKVRVYFEERYKMTAAHLSWIFVIAFVANLASFYGGMMKMMPSC